jgi:phage terminase small subunit
MPRTVKKDPTLQPGKPTKPTNLSDRASREWDRLVTELDASHIQISASHRTLLQLASTVAADIAKAYAVVQEKGEYIENRKTGAVQLHPACKMLNELRRDYIKIMVTLGTRAQAAPPPPDEGPSLEDVLNS